MLSKVWDEIIHPLINFNGLDEITYPVLNFNTVEV